MGDSPIYAVTKNIRNISSESTTSRGYLMFFQSFQNQLATYIPWFHQNWLFGICTFLAIFMATLAMLRSFKYQEHLNRSMRTDTFERIADFSLYLQILRSQLAFVIVFAIHWIGFALFFFVLNEFFAMFQR
jgi:hypothetical protein